MKTQTNKTVLITGANGGMGRAAAELLASKGYLVLAMDLRQGEARRGVIPIAADVTSEESLLSALEEVRRHVDRLDVILHFAGIYMLNSLVELSDADFQRIVNVNFRGAFLVNRTFLPLLGKGSRILMVTSELAVPDPLPFTGIYAVTKSALDRYAYSLRMELQLLGIKVSVLRAGAVETDMLGASTAALERFCETTRLYSCNAKRFRSVVDRVEARCVPPSAVAKSVDRILSKRSPAFAYSLNRNPLLLLLDLLPMRLRFWIIGRILR